MIGTDPVVTLDLWLTDEPACEGPHDIHGCPCTVHVTYRVTSCVDAFLCCAAYVEHPTRGVRVRAGLNECRDCERPASECWRAVPV